MKIIEGRPDIVVTSKGNIQINGVDGCRAMSNLESSLFQTREQQSGLERAYDLLFEHGNRNEVGPFERKDFALTAIRLAQHKTKLVETIAAMANSGHSTGLILCREPDPNALVDDHVDWDEIDQALRANVGPAVTFSAFRREIRGRTVDIIVIPRSILRPHVIYDKASQRFHIPIRGAAGNATAARHAIDAIYREDELERLRQAFPAYRLDSLDPARAFLGNIGYGLDPERGENPRPFAAQVIIPVPIVSRIDPKLFEETAQNRMKLIRTTQDVANGTEGLPQFHNYFSLITHGELFREDYIEHYEFAAHESQIAYLWGVRIYANGAIVRRSVIWEPTYGTVKLGWYKDEIAATIIFAMHAWRNYGISDVTRAECFSILRGAEARGLSVESGVGLRTFPPAEMEHLTVLPDTSNKVSLQGNFGEEVQPLSDRFARLLRSRYTVAPRTT